ncbi:MAG: glycoside hydrolase family 65 protein [Chloroflexota bacterium]
MPAESRLSRRSGQAVRQAAPTELACNCPGLTPDLVPRLIKPFRVVAFDWDGTAVISRTADASSIRDVIERLLRAGVFVVVITGTNFQNIDRQLTSRLCGPAKMNLFVAANRGSEVFGFDVYGRPVVCWRRVATPEEDRLLTEVADALRDELRARTGLEIRVIYDRLNRRKVDLIPLPEWADPPKSAIGELLRVVESRLKSGGLAGGLAEAMELAHKVALTKGLADPRITSDVKHIEVGLTDKSDSIRWVVNELARPRGIAPEEILLGGDEFGPVGGLEGSDFRMLIPELANAPTVSVGAEPNGVPPPVVHLGGGPACFQALLRAIADCWEGLDPARLRLPAVPFKDPDWCLIQAGYEPTRERAFEALFAVANGYAGVRASLPEGTPHSAPGTYLAGVFDDGPVPGAPPELAVGPNWTNLRVCVEGQALSPDTAENIEHRRGLDLRQALFWREWTCRDGAGRTTRTSLVRLASLGDRHALLQSVVLVPEDYSGKVVLESRFAPPRRADGQPHPARLEVWPEGILVEWQVRGGIKVAFGIGHQTSPDVQPEVKGGDGEVLVRWAFSAEAGKPIRLDRFAVIFCSHDTPDPAAQAMARLRELAAQGAQSLVRGHLCGWDRVWQTVDVTVQGDEFAQRALRFAAYHLSGAANPETDLASVGARALTGPGYKGHVFWDTEIYMLPFFVFTQPAVARALLMYRYRTLPAARLNARRQGYRGALYAWESADTGEEATPAFALAADGRVIPILTGQLEHHISADIAYAVWHYWQATGDDEFFRQAGAEILVETARFWASRCRLGRDGLYHIHRVIGPDEYHEGVDDNAYTNMMAQWNLERAAEAVYILQQRWPEDWRRLYEGLGLDLGEPQEWAQVAARMYTGFDPKTGLFEQFRGYFGLEDIDLSAYRDRKVPIDVLLGADRVRRSKIIKQPDVVLLIYLLWDRFPPQVRRANFDYYEPRTAHGSSLSLAIHAAVAARLGYADKARKYFRLAAEVDLADRMGNVAAGVHAGALGGLWQAAVFGFLGLRPTSGGLAFSPNLPEEWGRLGLNLRWLGRELAVTAWARPRRLELRLEGQEPISLTLKPWEELLLTPSGRYLLGKTDGISWVVPPTRH